MELVALRARPKHQLTLGDRKLLRGGWCSYAKSKRTGRDRTTSPQFRGQL